MSAQENPDESFLTYMDLVQVNVGNAIPKLMDANGQDNAVSMFYQGVHDHDLARMTGFQANGDVASTLCNAT